MNKTTIIVDEGKFQHYCHMTAHPDIRWFINGVGNRTLQQASMCRGCGKIEWNDVKEVTEDKEENP